MMFHYWKKKLGLLDWTIDFQYNVEPEDMCVADSCGCTSWREEVKIAVVQILRPDRYRNQVVPFDVEKTIVHELLHLKLSFLSNEDGDLQDRIAHQLIDDLARAFVNVRREHKIAKETIAHEEPND